MNYEDARIQVLADLEKIFGKGIVLVDTATIEKPYGWVFFYNTEEYVKTRNPDVALMSNTPFIFTKSGEKFYLRLSCSVQEAVEEIEREQRLGDK